MTIAVKKPPTKAVNLRVPQKIKDLIDRAALARSKSRSEFMIDAAYRAAEETILDQRFVQVDKKSFAEYLRRLDMPVDAAAVDRLMSAPSPWKA